MDVSATKCYSYCNMKINSNDPHTACLQRKIKRPWKSLCLERPRKHKCYICLRKGHNSRMCSERQKSIDNSIPSQNSSASGASLVENVCPNVNTALPSTFLSSVVSAAKHCSFCNVKINSEDPHTACLQHTKCFANATFDPICCAACNAIFAQVKIGNKAQIELWKKRGDAMIKWAKKCNKAAPNLAPYDYLLPVHRTSRPLRLSCRLDSSRGWVDPDNENLSSSSQSSETESSNLSCNNEHFEEVTLEDAKIEQEQLSSRSASFQVSSSVDSTDSHSSQYPECVESSVNVVVTSLSHEPRHPFQENHLHVPTSCSLLPSPAPSNSSEKHQSLMVTTLQPNSERSSELELQVPTLTASSSTGYSSIHHSLNTPVYLLPADATMNSSFIQYKSVFIPCTGPQAIVLCGIYESKPAFQPLYNHPLLEPLIAASLPLDHYKSKSFMPVSDLIGIPFRNISAEKFGWSVSANPLTVTISSISDELRRILPFSMNSNEPRPVDVFQFIPELGTSDNIVSFASAQKLKPECHKLPEILAEMTSVTSQESRNKDFSARRHLLTLIKAHESAVVSTKLLDLIKERMLNKEQNDTINETQIISSFIHASVINHLAAPLQHAIIEAKNARITLRLEATRNVTPLACRFTLVDGPLFTAELFDKESVDEASQIAHAHAIFISNH